MTDLEKAKQINERIGLRADGRISVWCAGAWESSMIIANLQSRIENLERRLDKQDQSTSMSELSPVAQAVLDAVTSQMEGGWISPEFIPYEARKIAVALRAAVAHTQQHHGHDVWECDADELLAIAEELENNE